MNLVSEHIAVDDYEEAVELFFERGWTDGLPVVLPTRHRVEALIEHVGRDPQESLGPVPPRGGEATIEKVAINAEALPDPAHNLNGVSQTTHMCVSLAIVNEPIARALGFNSRDGVNLLTEGPQTHETLAAKTGTHAGALRRVLRLLASAGVFAEGADGRFELTPVGAALRSGPGSSRAAARLFAGPMVWQCWGDLLTTVRTGEPAFPRIFKAGSFEYFADHPEEAAVFDEAMGSFTAMISDIVAAAYDFSGMREVIDVGGGDGRLLTGILHAYPDLRGTVLDRPRLAATAMRQIADTGLADRYRFVGGDFFEAVPEGCDAYLLKHVIHDWDDARAVHILENCRRAMKPGAKLLIIEGVYPPRIDGSPESRGAAANDVNMLVCTGGRQRSEAEFRSLYTAAGFRLTRIIPTVAASCLIEGTGERG